MVYDNLPVGGGMNVQLDCFGAQLDCSEKGWNRVLGQRLVRSAVRDPFRADRLARRAQALPSMVSLGRMGAKL
ncbi:MAG: hypothetical protein ACJ772_12840 [Gemmatimonadaceae bacterium]